MKKTAVELLAEQIQEQLNMFFPGATLDKLMIERAKLNEKQNIINTWYDSKISTIDGKEMTGMQYYKEKFEQQ
jgi:hypothetical protein